MASNRQNGDQQADLVDELLVEYFRWIDSGGVQDVDAFLLSLERPVDDPRLARSLRAYLADADQVQRLAADMTSLWLEDELAVAPQPIERANNEQLPRTFGDYELLEEIARGGMGIVYKARQKRLNRIVCIKRILLGEFATQREIERFLAEAEAAANLHHPHIVTIHEVGLDKGEYFFSMEYVSGPSLSECVAAGPLTPHRAAKYVSTIARAVHYAHQNNVLHRDLKPSNVVLDEEDQPHLTDFGLAKRVGAGALTATGALVGSPSYMAPEQTRGDSQSLDVTCDVYGLGGILYELVTGHPPFRGDTPLDTLWRVREHEPIRPSLHNSKVPRDLETICLKCLEKIPQRRYHSSLAVADELDRFLSGVPIHARPIGHPRKTVRWIRRNPIAVTICTALIIFAAVSFWAYKSSASSLSQLQESHEQQSRLALQLKDARDGAQDHLYLAIIHMARQALEDGQLDRLDMLLQRAKPSFGQRDRRGWEWYFLNALAHQPVMTFRGDGRPVNNVTWGPHGRRLASVGHDRSLRIWDAANGQLLHRLEGVGGVSDSIAWSEATDRIAIVGSDGVISIWETQSGTLVLQLSDELSPSRVLAWEPDGQRLAAGSDDGSVSVWDPEIGQLLWRLPLHDQRVNSIIWSPDGRLLASAGDDGTVHVVSASDSQSVGHVTHRDWVNDLAWSPDGLRLASVSEDGELKVTSLHVSGGEDSLEMQELFARFSEVGNRLFAVAFSPDGLRLVTGGNQPWLTIRDIDTGVLLGRLRGHRAPVRSVVWNDESGRIASAGDDGEINVWDVNVQPEGTLQVYSSAPIRTVAWSPNGQWIAYRDVENGVTVRRFAAGEQSSQIAELPDSAQAFAWHPNSRTIALATGHIVTLLNLANQQQRAYLEEHKGPVWTLCFSPTGDRLSTGGNDGRVIIWSTATRMPIHTLHGHNGEVRALAWDTNGELIASADADGTVSVFRAESGEIQCLFSASTSSINSLCFSPDNLNLAVSTHEGNIGLYNASTGAVMRTLSGHRGPVWSAIWSRDGSRLASSGQDSLIRIWDPSSGEEVLQLEGHTGAAWSLDWSPDGDQLISASADQTVRLWDARRGYPKTTNAPSLFPPHSK